MLSLALFILVAFLLLVFSFQTNSFPVSVKPTLVPTSTPSLIPVSRWASDEKFIKMEQDIEQTEIELNQISQLKEVELTPPILDLSVRF